jgi:predicted RNA-binding protein with EMAP domain
LDSSFWKTWLIVIPSPEIQNELIDLLGARVCQTIISSIQKAKYYSIIFYTTPDNAHIEQMSQIVRFVEIQRDSTEIKEAFIDFIPLDEKTAEIITAEITKKLERGGLNLEGCRVQSYANQATMAGVHSGVQKRILDLNLLAVFVPCNNHSFIFFGIHAGYVHVQALTNFGTVERLFLYFSCSIHRWSVLNDFVNISVKRHSDTRWSSKAGAVNAISRQLEKVIAALEQLCDILTETLDTREDAALILNGIEKLEILPCCSSGQKFSLLLIGFRNVLRLKQQLFIKH